MATKRRGKGKGRTRSVAAAVSPSTLIAAAQTARVEPATHPKKPKPTKAKKPPRRPARRVSGKPAAKPEVVARTAARGGRRRDQVDHAARRRAERLVAQIRKRKQRITRDFYVMGKALAELSEPRLLEALGYRSLNELLSAHSLVSRTTAFKLISVVEAYPREQALDLGLEKAYGLIQWSRAVARSGLGGAPRSRRAVSRASAPAHG